MALYHSPRTVTNGLILNLDATNPRSYPGTGTTWFDMSGNNNHGTLTNMNVPACYVRTYGGRALDFDGVNDYVTSVAPASLLGGRSPITVSFWTYQRVNTRNMASVAIEPLSGNTFTITSVVLGGPTYYIWTDSITSNFAVPAAEHPQINTWNNIIVSWDGSTLFYYLNGIFKRSQAYSNSIGVPSSIRIGARFQPGPAYYDGQIDDVRVYNRALSLAEIRQNYNATRGRFGV